MITHISAMFAHNKERPSIVLDYTADRTRTYPGTPDRLYTLARRLNLLDIHSPGRYRCRPIYSEMPGYVFYRA